MFERWLPLAGLAALVLLGAVLRAVLQRVRFGSSGVHLFRERRPAALLRDAGFVALVAALVGQALALALGAELGRFFACPAWLAAAVMGLGLGVLLAAQLHLGASWRVGIEPDARPGLVRRGLYRWSRNPIFAGLLLVVAGHALAAPTWLSFAALAALAIGVRLQVRDEERWLRGAYGREFEEYASRVGRFVPGLGRLRDPRDARGTRVRTDPDSLR